MIECILSWLFLIVGFAMINTDLNIASGIFAAAAHLGRIAQEKKRDEN